MMAMKSTVRVYDTELGRNRAVGSLTRNGWRVSNRGAQTIDGHTVYTITCYKPWPTVGRILRAMRAARDAFMEVINRTERQAA